MKEHFEFRPHSDLIIRISIFFNTNYQYLDIVTCNDVPTSIPTGKNASKLGRDGWADGTDRDFSSGTGFERELSHLMRSIYDNNIKNVVFETTDAHFPIMLKYNANVNRDGDPVNIYEIVW